MTGIIRKLFKSNGESYLDQVQPDKWANLFTTNARLCQANSNIKFSEDGKPIIEFPKQKYNKYERKHGSGSKITFMFDYFDDLFQKEITAQFTKMWEEQKKFLPNIQIYITTHMMPVHY